MVSVLMRLGVSLMLRAEDFQIANLAASIHRLLHGCRVQCCHFLRGAYHCQYLDEEQDAVDASQCFHTFSFRESRSGRREVNQSDLPVSYIPRGLEAHTH